MPPNPEPKNRTMYSIYYHELQSYRTQLEEIRTQLGNLNEIDNLTHFSLARSNRINFMVVGLIGLVEAYLYETAENHPEFDASDVLHPGSSFDDIKSFLSKNRIIDFSKLRYWAKFMCVKKIRDKIVHGYGGMIIKKFDSKFLKNFEMLGLNPKKYLIAKRRIRFDADVVELIIDITDKLFQEIEKQRDE